MFRRGQGMLWSGYSYLWYVDISIYFGNKYRHHIQNIKYKKMHLLASIMYMFSDPDGYEICFVEDKAFYDLAIPTYDMLIYLYIS
jgi:hypothetical protein